MLDDILESAKSQMEKSVDSLKKHLASIRTGRAHVSLLDGIRIDYYGTPTPLAQVASVQVIDARTLAIKPWEAPLTKLIEKAILESRLGLNPAVDGNMIRLPVPALTEERRKEYVKQSRQRGEEAKIAVRNERRDANEMLKATKKDGDISEDDEKRGLKETQTLTDACVKQIDELLVHKEKEIMTV